MTGALRTYFLQPANLSAREFLRSPPSSGHARRAVLMCRPCATNRSSSEPGHHLSGWPALVKAATGESSAPRPRRRRRPYPAFRRRRPSGGNDAHALAIVRRIVASLSWRRSPALDPEPSPPLRRRRDLWRRPTDPANLRRARDRRPAGGWLSFDEFKARYGTTLVCGFARPTAIRWDRGQQRHPVFRIRPQRRALSELCAQRHIPPIFRETSPASWSAKPRMPVIAWTAPKMSHGGRHRRGSKPTVIIIGNRLAPGNWRRAAPTVRASWTWPPQSVGGEQNRQRPGDGRRQPGRARCTSRSTKRKRPSDRDPGPIQPRGHLARQRPALGRRHHRPGGRRVPV